MSRARRSSAGAVGMLAVAGYGVSLSVVGVLVGLGVGNARPAAASLADGTYGRPVSVAPVVAPHVVPDSQGSAAFDHLFGDPVDPATVMPALADRPAKGQVQPFQPQLIVLPGKQSARVQAVGLHPDGALVIPDDPAVVGWWTGGAQAGDVFGSMVIAGHVDSHNYGIGVLARLKQAKMGQVIEVRSGTQRRRYRISSRVEIQQAQLVTGTDAFRQDVAARLVLITCGGPFDLTTHRYRDNLVIYAAPIG